MGLFCKKTCIPILNQVQVVVTSWWCNASLKSTIPILLSTFLAIVWSSSISAQMILLPDKVLVNKSKRMLYLLKKGEILRSYSISLGQSPTGSKFREGDSKTPIGNYILDWRNPRSKFYLSIHISYPDKNDIQKAKKLGVTPGGDIMIHGLPNDNDKRKKLMSSPDWTNGCIAVNNADMAEIWSLVKDGTPIEIRE